MVRLRAAEHHGPRPPFAAGRGSRFGDIGSKLEARCFGRAVGLHVAVALEDLPFRRRIAVTGPARLDYAAHGFETIANDDPEQGMARSVRLGVAEAMAMGADAVLIALADMPRVTAAHIHRLFDAADAADAVVVSSDGRTPMPPGVFGHERFDFLLSLIDVDTPEELERLRGSAGAPEALTRYSSSRIT